MVVLYIDPGTGSMLFAILIGIIGALNYMVRSALVKIRFILSGGKNVEANADSIPYVIFSDNKRYWNVFEPVCREFDRRQIDVVYLTASDDDPALTSDIPHLKAEFAGEGNKAFARLNLLRADVLLSTTPGLDVYQWKRSLDVKYYVHMLHALGETTLYRMFGLDYYDSVLVAGEFQREDIRALEKMRELPAKELPLGGIPYMDKMLERLENAEPLPADRPRTVLLAPSWGPSAIFAKYGGAIIETLLSTGYHVVVRPHPQSFTSETEMMDKLMAAYPASDRLEWNRDNDNFECLRSADILISDFSGVIFEFAMIFDKPVIYTNPNFDLDPYDAWWLDKEIWTVGALPRIGMELTEERAANLREVVDLCIQDESFARGRDELRAEAWQGYGEGAKLTVDYLVAKRDELLAKHEGVK